LYPLPENVGLSLDVTQGDLVKAVKDGSPAAKVGLQPGDVLLTLNNNPVTSFADAQYALHKAPSKGAVPVSWQHGKEQKQDMLQLAPGWRKTNITWRPSLLDILPSVPLYGEDLEAQEKVALKLSPKHLAFRQDKIVAFAAKEAGVKSGDIIVGVNGLELELDMVGFLGYVRQNFLAGDEITLNLIRDGKKLNLSLKLPW
jgi:S1-C subfamily serine protease